VGACASDPSLPPLSPTCEYIYVIELSVLFIRDLCISVRSARGLRRRTVLCIAAELNPL